MTALAAARELVGGVDDEVARLRSLLDPEFLAAAGWDPEAQVLAPPPEHPHLGYRVCRVNACTAPTSYANGLCSSCRSRYRACDLDLEAFLTAGAPPRRPTGERPPCTVPDCQRPVKTSQSGLCAGHEGQRRQLGIPLQAFLARPGMRPLPSLGDCCVVACRRRAATTRGLCWAHDQRWRLHGHGTEFETWRRRTPPVAEGGTVVLRGLAPLVQAQVLLGLQDRCRRDLTTKLETLRGLCDHLRAEAIATVLDLDPASLRWEQRDLARCIRATILRALSSPEIERRKDRWDMGVFGLGNKTIDFAVISQLWLRAAVQDWVGEEAPTRRGKTAADALRAHVNAIGELSASLRLQQADLGSAPAALGRGDIVAFLHRLTYLEDTGRLSADRHRRIARQVAMVLRDCRTLGLTQPGQPMAGLPDSFALRPGDVPQEPRDDEPGRALPPGILRQLSDNLLVLEERAGREFRVAVQLLMDTGRRPTEICALPWDCLEQDADAKHALVYADFKANRIGRRLAISDATAEVIRLQRQAVRAQFPNTPPCDLVLLPTPRRNPKGMRHITYVSLGDAHRRWVAGLPSLWLDEDQCIEFDKAKAIPYAYRHSYAQRHADAGTPVDVLCELMGHVSMATTQTYYWVTAKRTRAAVDRLAAFHFDSRGTRVWSQARALLEHEHQRLAVGQVAVPFGICTEPSNVQAGGGACPFRFRCVGCGHFRTDPSYLPELRDYLDTLLRNRERVRAAVELDDWARAEAMPSDQEITRLRQLIRKVEHDLKRLGDTERQQVDEACRVVRATRQTVHLGMPTIRPPDPDPALETPA